MSLIGRTFVELRRGNKTRIRRVLTDPALAYGSTWFVWTELAEAWAKYRMPRVFHIEHLPDDLAAEAFDMITPKEAPDE